MNSYSIARVQLSDTFSLRLRPRALSNSGRPHLRENKKKKAAPAQREPPRASAATTESDGGTVRGAEVGQR